MTKLLIFLLTKLHKLLHFIILKITRLTHILIKNPSPQLWLGKIVYFTNIIEYFSFIVRYLKIFKFYDLFRLVIRLISLFNLIFSLFIIYIFTDFNFNYLSAFYFMILPEYLSNVFNQLYSFIKSYFKNYFYRFILILSAPATLTAVSGGNFKYMFLFPFIYKHFETEIKDNPDPLLNYTFSMITLSLIVLFCFFNVLLYLISLYLIQNYNVEEKFPKLKKYINFYSKTTKIFIITESLIGFTFLLCILYINIKLFYTYLK
jgi:hypothetical protein